MNNETEQEEQVQEAPDPSKKEVAAKPRAIPEVVEFKHPFFAAVAGIYFQIAEVTETAVMLTPLDTGAVELSLTGIAKELKLEEGSDDAHMLETVTDSLQFVKRIGVGDPVPKELRTGEASWSISEQDREVAHGRLTMQLVTWLSGDEAIVTDREQLAMVTEDPATKSKINEAFGEAADKLGLGRENIDKVVDLVNNLADELSYIESLRRQLQKISVVETRLTDMTELYLADLSVMETLTPVSRLCSIAMAGFRRDFEDVDAQTGEIISVLKNIGAQIKNIRTNRDDLYRRFWAWKELVEDWEQQPANRSRTCEHLMHETYRFLAQRFLPKDDWELYTKAQGRAAESETESMW